MGFFSFFVDKYARFLANIRRAMAALIPGNASPVPGLQPLSDGRGRNNGVIPDLADPPQAMLNGQLEEIPWIKLRFDPRIGANSAQAADPQVPFHDAPPDLDDPNSPLWIDFTRPIPLHSTSEVAAHTEPGEVSTDTLSINVPSGQNHYFRRGNGDDNPLVELVDFANQLPAPVAEYATIQLGDVIRFMASRTSGDHPLSPVLQGFCPPGAIGLSGYPELTRLGNEEGRNRRRYNYDFEMEPGNQLDFSVLVSVESGADLEDQTNDTPPTSSVPDPLDFDGLMVGVGRVYNRQQDLTDDANRNPADAVLAIVGAGDYDRIHGGPNGFGRGKDPFGDGGSASFVQIGETKAFQNYFEDSPDFENFARFPGLTDTLNRSLAFGVGAGDRNFARDAGGRQIIEGDANSRRTARIFRIENRPVSQKFRFYISLAALPDQNAMDTTREYRTSFPRTLWARISVDMPGPNGQTITHAFSRSAYNDIYPNKEGLRIHPPAVNESRHYFPISARVGELGLLVGALANRQNRAPVTKVTIEDAHAVHYRRFDPAVGPEDGDWIKSPVTATPFD